MLTATRTNKKPRKPIAPMIPDFCPSCDAVNSPYRPAMKTTRQEFRGETLEVSSPVMKCRNCGHEILGPGQLDSLRLATTNAFRRKHGLLTADEIVLRRKAMRMSQLRFADYLGIGAASLKRWEASLLVQDRASDMLVREKTDFILYTPEIPIGMTPVMDTFLSECINGGFQVAAKSIDSATDWLGKLTRTQTQTYKGDYSHALAATA